MTGIPASTLTAEAIADHILGIKERAPGVHEVVKTPFDDFADLVRQGGKPQKKDVRALATTDVNMATAADAGKTFGGVTLVAGDEIAKCFQAGAGGHPTNGVYVVQATGAAVRRTDFDASTEILGAEFYVQAGTSAGETWGVQNQIAITVGTTAIDIVRIKSSPTDAVTTGGVQTLAGKTLTAPVVNNPDINGGTADSLTSFGMRSTGAAFDLRFSTAEVLTGHRSVTWTVNNLNRTITLNGNLAFGGSFTTSGAFALTCTVTATTNITLPTTGTLATLAGAETLGNKTINTSIINSPVINTPTGLVKSDVGLNNVDNTSDATKNAAAATLGNKTINTSILNSPVINTPTGLVKSDVGLNNVDNTSDATKNAAVATLANKRLAAPKLDNPLVNDEVEIGTVAQGAIRAGDGAMSYVEIRPARAETQSDFAVWERRLVNDRAMNERARLMSIPVQGFQPYADGYNLALAVGQSFAAGPPTAFKILLTTTALASLTYMARMIGDSDRPFGTGSTYDIIGTTQFNPLRSSVTLDGQATEYTNANIIAGAVSPSARGETPVTWFALFAEMLWNQHVQRQIDTSRRFVAMNGAKDGALLSDIARYPGTRWNFNTTAEGWTVASGATLSLSLLPGRVRLRPIGANPAFQSPAGQSIDGSVQRYVRARVRLVSGAATNWEGTCFYLTGSHGVVAGFRRDIANPNLPIGEWRVLEWDMHNLTAGGTDWQTSTILQIRLDFVSAQAGDPVFEVDWVEVAPVNTATYARTLDAADKLKTRVAAQDAPANSAAQWQLAAVIEAHGQADESALTPGETYKANHRAFLRDAVHDDIQINRMNKRLRAPWIAEQVSGPYIGLGTIAQAQLEMCLDQVNHPDYFLAGPAWHDPHFWNVLSPHPFAGNRHRTANGQARAGLQAAIVWYWVNVLKRNWFPMHIDTTNRPVFRDCTILVPLVMPQPPVKYQQELNGLVLTDYANGGFTVQQQGGWNAAINSVTIVDSCVIQVICNEPLINPRLGIAQTGVFGANFSDSMTWSTLAEFEYRFTPGYTDTDLNMAGWDDAAGLENIPTLIGQRDLSNHICAQWIDCVPADTVLHAWS